ncbi:S-layer homology domain-containing protein [Heliorestis convoluta]|uniref:S-layer domain-containing protein, putative n=1 Tax=Heliorestis convoluta TaxID=356322 RepID=A0A5Q2N133_9FIRM|nr:S-layer homology domain-containing protein [Heliorestis convoluta]QGG47286.1 S-layer domain-containing protein, putative [Heliorestis convoluta]
MKKLFKAMLILCLVIGTTTAAFAANFSDIKGHWAEPWITKMVNQNVISGYPDSTYRPDHSITRAEFTTLVNKSFNKHNPNAQANFQDVKTTDWHYSQIASGQAAGYISGYPDGTFRPDNSITREEAAVLIAKVLQLQTTTTGITFTDSNQIENWSRASIAAITAKGIMTGYPDGTFQPQRPINRAEAAVLLDKAMNTPVEPRPEVGISGTINIANATVKLFEAGTLNLISETTTDQQGNYKFNVQSGQYDITVQKDNFIGYASDITLNKDTKSINITLTEGVTVEGRLVDRNNRNVANADIAFKVNPVFTTKTDSTGKYKITLLPNKRYQVSAIDPNKKDEGWQKVTDAVTVGEKSVTLSNLTVPFTVPTSSSGGGSRATDSGYTIRNNIATVTTVNGLLAALNDGRATTINGQEESFSTNITINRPNITLKNITIDGNVHVAEEILESDLTLENVIITGQTTFAGGGSQSIKLLGTTELRGPVTSRKEGLRIVAEGTAKVTGTLTLERSATIESDHKAFEQIHVALAGSNTRPIVIAVPGATITATKDVDVRLELERPATVKTDNNSTVNNLVIRIQKDVQTEEAIKIEATVTTVTLEKLVANSIIEIAEAAQVSDLKIDSQITSPIELEIRGELSEIKADSPDAVRITIALADSREMPQSNISNIPQRVLRPTASTALSGKDVIVTLTPETSDSKIYYAINEEPNVQNENHLYNGPFTITDTSTIKAIATKEVLEDSRLLTLNVTYYNATFQITPEEATIEVKNSNNEPITAEQPGTYRLPSGFGDYSYKVTKEGYRVKEGTFTIEEDITIAITLEALPTLTIAGEEPDAENRFSIPFNKITRQTIVHTSESGNLTFWIEDLGPFGGIELQEGDNNLFNLDITTINENDLNQINYTQLMEALRGTDPDTRKAILNAIDFEEILNLSQNVEEETLQTITSHIAQEFETVFSMMQKANQAQKDQIKADLNKILDILMSETYDVKTYLSWALFPAIKEAERLTLVSKEDFGLDELTAEKFNEAVRTNAISNTQLKDAVKKALSATDETHTESIINEIEQEHLINAINATSNNNKKDIIKAVNINNLFEILRDKSEQEEKEAIFSLAINMISALESDSNVALSDIFEAIAFDTIGREALFAWLAQLKDPSNEINITFEIDTVEYTLTITNQN